MLNALDTRRAVPLSGGLTLSIEEYGVPTGIPVFFFHGWPGSAVQGALLHEAAERLGIRIISMDRPGIGGSAPQISRRLVDWPPVLQQLAAALGLSRYRVLGVSGGGPYALASAWGLPDEIEAATVVCGAPPLAELGTAQGFNPVYRAMLSVYHNVPSAIRGLFRIVHPLGKLNPPPWMMFMLRGALVPPDRKTLADPAISKMCHEGFRGAWGNYRDGVFEDAQIYTQPWGFPIENIKVPVRLWHGTEDGNFAHTLTSYSQRIPGSELRLLPNEGHYSLPILRAEEILADLLATPARS